MSFARPSLTTSESVLSLALLVSRSIADAQRLGLHDRSSKIPNDLAKLAAHYGTSAPTHRQSNVLGAGVSVQARTGQVSVGLCHYSPTMRVPTNRGARRPLGRGTGSQHRTLDAEPEPLRPVPLQVSAPTGLRYGFRSQSATTVALQYLVAPP